VHAFAKKKKKINVLVEKVAKFTWTLKIKFLEGLVLVLLIINSSEWACFFLALNFDPYDVESIFIAIL
jgi:hypothetical protein